MKEIVNYLGSQKQSVLSAALTKINQRNYSRPKKGMKEFWNSLFPDLFDALLEEINQFHDLSFESHNKPEFSRPIAASGVKQAGEYFKSGGSLIDFISATKQFKTSCIEVLNNHFETKSIQEISGIIISAFDNLELCIINEWEDDTIQEFSLEKVYMDTLTIYESTFNNNHSIMMLIDPETGIIFDANYAAVEFYGYKISELKSMNIAELNILTDAEVRQEMNRAIASERTTFNFCHRLSDGSIKDVEVTSGPITLGNQRFLFSIIYDITQRKKTESALAENEERLRTFMDAVNEAILVFDDSLNLNNINKSADAILDGVELFMGKHISNLFDTYLDEYNLIEIFKAQNSTEPYVFQTILRSKLQGEVHLEIDAFKVGKGLGVIIRDISRQKEYEFNLQFSAHHDALTKLPNRTLFYDRLGQAIKKATRDESQLAVLFIDLDGFKAVNDLYGHEVGDEVLTDIAQSLLTCLRKSDTVARMGGDEFTILLDTVNSDESAMTIAEKVLESIEREIVRGDGKVYVTASIGISMFPNDSYEIEELIQIADKAMYKAKNSTDLHISFP